MAHARRVDCRNSLARARHAGVVPRGPHSVRLTLRDYQNNVVGSIYKYFAIKKGNPVVEAPTSAGKSLIMADFTTGVLERWPGQRILILAHVRELIEQNYLELMGYWPEAPAGVNAAQLGRRDMLEPILFAMIQSIYKNALQIGWRDLVLIDECHLVPVRTSDGMYRKLLSDMLEINPNLKVIGLSATPYRLDNGMLTEGKNRIFTDIIPAKANGCAIEDLLERGYLSPLITPDAGVSTRLNLEGVRKSGADYNQKQLAAAVDVDETTRAAVSEIVALGADRKSWLIFATSVEHAHHIRDELRWEHDIETELVSGKTPKGERSEIAERFKRQELRALVNVNCLTTGFNARGVDLLAFLRPTHSTNLYVQMCGRGMRLSPETGKTDCLVLDFAGLIAKHGPVNDVTPPAKRGEGNGEAPVKECDQCFMIVAAGASVCEYCGYEFPPPEPGENLNETASTADIIAAPKAPYNKNAPERHEVNEVRFFAHVKDNGKAPSLRVEYWRGDGLLKVKVASEWVNLFSPGKGGRDGRSWWIEHVAGDLNPGDIFQAVEWAEKHARPINYIFTVPDGKYKKVVSRGYEEPAVEVAS